MQLLPLIPVSLADQDVFEVLVGGLVTFEGLLEEGKSHIRWQREIGH